MTVRAGLGQCPERASARPGLAGRSSAHKRYGQRSPVPPISSSAQATAARRIEPAINWRASRAIPSLAVTLTPAGPCGRFPSRLLRTPPDKPRTAATKTPSDPLDKHKSIDMCVLQPISYSLLVAFCYRHLPPPKSKGARLPDHGLASASGGRAARQIPARRQGLSYSGGSPPWRDRLVPIRDKAAARSFGSPFAPQQQKRSRYSCAELRPGRDPEASQRSEGSSAHCASSTAISSGRLAPFSARAASSQVRGSQDPQR